MDAYVDMECLKKKFAGKKCFIFGAGIYGAELFDRGSKILNIEGFIDNHKTGTWCGLPIYSLKEMQQIRRDELIFISSGKYENEMGASLETAGLKKGKDYFIWVIRFFARDENVQHFIAHNKEVWGPVQKVGKKNKIMIPYLPAHDSYLVILSYCAHFLANRHNADIWCFGASPRESDSSVREVYESFHVKFFVELALNEEQQQRATDLWMKLLQSLKKREDWTNIEVDGQNYGKEICRHFLRFGDVTFDLRKERTRSLLRMLVEEIIFWNDFFDRQKDVRAIVLGDAIYNAGIRRIAAIRHHVEAYAISDVDSSLCDMDQCLYLDYKYYKDFFLSLTKEEQIFGIAWAKDHLNRWLNGEIIDREDVKTSVYASEFTDRILKPTNHIKVLICTHTFSDFMLEQEWQIFLDPYEWLCYLGDLSSKTPYDWYVKCHPHTEERDKSIIGEILRKYPSLTLLPETASPEQLKQEDLNFALTCHGSVGHEYPLLGIPVINAGSNPHIAFDFNWNPKSKAEYQSLLMNLDTLHKDIDTEEVYQFYCIQYYYFLQRNLRHAGLFFRDTTKHGGLMTTEMYTSERYRYFLEEWSPTRHAEISSNVEKWFEIMDSYKEGEFRRRDKLPNQLKLW